MHHLIFADIYTSRMAIEWLNIYSANWYIPFTPIEVIAFIQLMFNISREKSRQRLVGVKVLWMLDKVTHTKRFWHLGISTSRRDVICHLAIHNLLTIVYNVYTFQ